MSSRNPYLIKLKLTDEELVNFKHIRDAVLAQPQLDRELTRILTPHRHAAYYKLLDATVEPYSIMELLSGATVTLCGHDSYTITHTLIDKLDKLAHSYTFLIFEDDSPRYLNKNYGPVILNMPGLGLVEDSGVGDIVYTNDQDNPVVLSGYYPRGLEPNTVNTFN